MTSSRDLKVAILTSHPIQYHSPWFRALAKEVDLEVFFAHRQSAADQGKAGFGVPFDWDVDLLSGYKHRFLKNVSSNPGVCHYSGCDTPEIREVLRGLRSTEHGPRTTDRFDAFIVTGWYLKSYLQAVRACRHAGIPVLVRGDSQLQTPRSAIKRLLMEFRQRWLLRQFDGFLTVGKRNREYLEHYGARADRIFFAPHFVDNEWFAGKAAKVRARRSEVRRQWGADDGTFVALFVGKFIEKKRPADLLRALATVNSQSPTLNFLAVFIGSGDLENALRGEAEQLNVKARFDGFKNQTELPTSYASADALVLPSDGGETWGLVVNEAMACGLPAIVSDAVGCAADLIEEGRTGFTFPCGDSSQLAERLATLATMKQKGHDFTHALAEKMHAYSVQAAVAGTIQAVNTLARARRLAAKAGARTEADVPLTEARPASAHALPRLDHCRVLVLFGGIGMHGSERGNIEVFRCLAQLGLKARFVTHRQWGHLHIQPELDRLGFEWTTAPFGPNLSWKLLGLDFFRMVWGLLVTNWIFWREVRRWRPTHLHTPDARYVFYCTPAILLSRTPLIYRLGDAPAVHNVVHRTIWRLVKRRTSFFVCNSRYVHETVGPSPGKPKRSTIIHSALPARAECSNPVPADSWPGALKLVFIGQIREQKGVPVLVETVRALLNRDRNVTLWLAGDYSWRNPMAERMIAELKAEGLDSKIQFLGYVENIPSLLNSSELHVCPSVCQEALANVVLEAKAAGIPSVVFPNGGLPEMIEHKVDGYICPDSSVEALLEGISYFLDHPDERKRAGGAARRSLEEKFGEDRFKRQWAEVFLASFKQQYRGRVSGVVIYE